MYLTIEICSTFMNTRGGGLEVVNSQYKMDPWELCFIKGKLNEQRRGTTYSLYL